MGRHIRWFIISFRRHSLLKNVFLLIFLLWLCYIINELRNDSKISTTPPTLPLTIKIKDSSISLRAKQEDARKFYNDSEFRKRIFERKLEKLTQLVKKNRAIPFSNNSIPFPFYNVHVFYYAWYGNIKFDNSFLHWNHQYIPSWKRDDKIVHRRNHEAPLDIGSNFFPFLGCYSSRDPEIVRTHLKQMKYAGAGVVVVSWTPPGMRDSPSDIFPILFDYAEKCSMKITLHVEPYPNRNPTNLRHHLIQFFSRYFNHPALYKVQRPNKNSLLPVIYIYDSYLTQFSAWNELLSFKGNISVRGTKYDAIFIGLLVDQQHRFHIKKSHFDGFYTYFASNGFTHGSTWKNWNSLAKFARQNHLIFIPSVGPGYIDTQIRPWNSANTRHRRNGQYYDVAWRSAISTNAEFISVTSFNEWHEGTQIEPAQTKAVTGFTYMDYSPEGPYFYLNLTRWWVDRFFNSRKHNKI